MRWLWVVLAVVLVAGGAWAQTWHGVPSPGFPGYWAGLHGWLRAMAQTLAPRVAAVAGFMACFYFVVKALGKVGSV